MSKAHEALAAAVGNELRPSLDDLLTKHGDATGKTIGFVGIVFVRSRVEDPSETSLAVLSLANDIDFGLELEDFVVEMAKVFDEPG